MSSAKQQVTIRMVTAWNFLLADRPAGQAIRALTWLGPDQASAVLPKLRTVLPPQEWDALLSVRAELPLCLAELLSEQDQQLLPSLTFKGGTSLSKAHGLIDRFLEDVDLMGGAVACLRFALDFALFGPAGPASDTLNDKKDPLRRKEPNKMEPSGFEPLTPCMPCRCSTS